MTSRGWAYLNVDCIGSEYVCSNKKRGHKILIKIRAMSMY